MAKFCTRCGRPLEEGEVCTCETTDASETPKFDTNQAGTFWETFKNHVGLSDPEFNGTDVFESGKLIIPECVKANEGEIPVKQYTVATLKNRLLGITYAKAIGRIQVTNKRVIFRAPGRSLRGRTSIQHEFAIDDVSGIEARREYTWNFWDFLSGLFIIAISVAIAMGLITLLSKDTDDYSTATTAWGIMLGAAGCIPFFALKNKWGFKLMSLGLSVGAIANIAVSQFTSFSYFSGSSGSPITTIFLGIIPLLLLFFTWFIYTIRPNLVLQIKTNGASNAIDICRMKITLFNIEEHTGFKDVIPADNAEECIREIDAIINDIQKLGDFGIEKWKA